MTRKIASADTTSVTTESSETCQSPGKPEIDGPSEMKGLGSNNNMAEVAQQERQTLPGVTSLINSQHLQLAALAGLPSLSSHAYNQELKEDPDVKTGLTFVSSAAFSQQLKEEPEVKTADMTQTRVDGSIPHFHTADVSYLASNADTDKTEYMQEEQDIIKNYKESVSYSVLQHKVTPLNKSVSDLIGPEAPLIAGAIDSRAASEHRLQLSFEDHRGFVNHSRMCYSGNLVEPLSPATAPSEKHLDACVSAVDRSPVNYSYQNYLSSWEQENNRFFNLTCRNEVYAEKAIAGGNPGEVGSAKTHVKNYGIVNNINIDNCCFSKSFVTDASCGSLGSNGRRRRRRVQTPVQRTAANMRERRRMCHLNVAFDRLKERLPNIKNKQKLSRIQTLKAAIDYINLLRDSLSLR
ncbi:hypothetical protein BsWGS_02074 [Bradybaena similaris]